MAISDGEQELFDQAQAMLAEQTVFTDERILFAYAPREMEMLLHAADLEDWFTDLKDVINDVSDMLSEYSSSNNPFSSKDELILEITNMCNFMEEQTGVTTHIASDGSFAFEGQYYTTQYPLNTVSIGYSSEYGLAPVAKEKTSYIYTEYFLTADDLPVLTADNATFKGWMLDGVTVDEGVAVSGDVTLVADWEVTAVKATITYHSAHGQVPEPVTVTLDSFLEYPLSEAELPTLSAEGYAFLGWGLSENDTTPIIPGAHFISGDTNLYALWQAITVDYTISYQTAHGTAPASKTVTVNEGESYALTADDLPILSADGYIFGGWAINGEITSAGQAISADTVLTAVWVEDSPVSKIDPISLMIGYFTGQAIRRMRGQKQKTLVGYLYGHVAKDGETPTHTINGVGYVGAVLPDINSVWDKEAYPYAVVRVNAGYDAQWISFSSVPFYIHPTNPNEWVTNSAVCNSCYYALSNGSWVLGDVNVDKPANWIALDPDDVIWTSHNIYTGDGSTLYLAASDPIPVYE